LHDLTDSVVRDFLRAGEVTSIKKSPAVMRT